MRDPGIDFIGGAKMGLRFVRAIRLPVQQAEIIQSRIEAGVQAHSLLQMLERLIGTSLLPLNSADEVVHFRRGLQRERTF